MYAPPADFGCGQRPRGATPLASLSLQFHQVVKGTFTPKLSNMLGTQEKASGSQPEAFRGKE
jgi:hypothetical protein